MLHARDYTIISLLLPCIYPANSSKGDINSRLKIASFDFLLQLVLFSFLQARASIYWLHFEVPTTQVSSVWHLVQAIADLSSEPVCGFGVNLLL
jgi:hypothetical protein